MTPDQIWEPTRYDRQFAFVSGLGGGALELADPQPGERMFDLGCGTGTLMEQAHRRGVEVSGMDADPAMVRAALELLPEADIRVGDGQEFAVDEPVDLVFSNAAIHWMPRQDSVARCVARALRPGGRFVAELGGAGNVATIVDAVRRLGRDEGVEVASPWTFPTVAELATHLERAGLRVAHLEHFARPTPLAGEHGIVDWLTMFGGALLAGWPDPERARVRQAVEQDVRDWLWSASGWRADYWRLRFVALAPG